MPEPLPESTARVIGDARPRPLRLPCPTCGAMAGYWCRSREGIPTKPHVARRRALPRPSYTAAELKRNRFVRALERMGYRVRLDLRPGRCREAG